MEPSLWSFLDAAIEELDLAGYAVDAVDGRAGTVASVGSEGDARFLCVDTGLRFFGRQVVVPASLVGEVDAGRELLTVNCTCEQLRGSPAPDPERGPDAEYRRLLDGYYGGQRPPSATVSEG